jgi:hypothetical protein
MFSNNNFMQLKIYFLFLNFFMLSGIQAQDFDLKVIAIDKNNSNQINFATVFISPCQCGGSTKSEGFFTINLPQNEYRVITSCIGFQSDTSDVFLDKNLTLTIALDSKGYTLKDITISGQSTRQNIERTVMGVQQLSADNIKMLPTAIGEVDVLNSLTMLPGVSSAGEASNGLSVRGGSLDQNLVLLDYAPIFNPTHLFGVFSVFTPEAVGGVELYRANMPAKYGGRISSVVDVKVKNPDAEKLTLTGGIGFVSSRLSVETPIIKNKLSLLAAARVSFNDFIFNRINKLKNTRANFWDGTLKLKFQANEKNSFFLTGFFSHDFYQLDISSRINTITASSNQYDYSTLNGTLNWLHTFGSKSFLRTTLVRSDFTPKILFPQQGSAHVVKFESRIQYYSLQSEVFKTLNPEWDYSGGIQIDKTTLSPGSLLPGKIENIEKVELPDENGVELSTFANVNWVPSQKIAFSLGLRYTQFLLLGPYEQAEYDDVEKENLTSIIAHPKGEIVKSYGGLEPRFGMRWKVSENTSLKASYSLTRQYLQNIYNSTTPLPTSRWKTSDIHIAPQSGHTYSLGVYQNIKNNKITMSLESYFRTINNVLDYKPGADFFLQNFIEKDVLQGKARNYGLEFNFEQPNGPVNGWFNYTWSRSIRKFEAMEIKNRINNNEWFSSDFDRPHVFNGTINFKLNDFNVFSFNFIYQTGKPYTLPNAVFLVNNISIPVFLERNNGRLPDYHRLDFSWRIHNITTQKENRWKGDWIFTVYNLYNRKNAFNRYFGSSSGQLGAVSNGGPIGAYQLSIFSAALISLTYSFKFL